jgi:predicted deacylase
VCTHVTETLSVSGSAKGSDGWFRVTDASVYFDHPVHALADHTLNVDLRRPADGPGARVAVELTADAARELATAILRVLDQTGVVGQTGRRSPTDVEASG